jgi:hypothetical protein
MSPVVGFLGDWCNGSTTDSDSVSLGSNPRSPIRSGSRGLPQGYPKSENVPVMSRGVFHFWIAIPPLPPRGYPRRHGEPQAHARTRRTAADKVSAWLAGPPTPRPRPAHGHDHRHGARAVLGAHRRAARLAADRVRLRDREPAHRRPAVELFALMPAAASRASAFTLPPGGRVACGFLPPGFAFSISRLISPIAGKPQGMQAPGGRVAKQYTEATGLDVGTLQNIKSVSMRFETSRRREVLSFKHHAEVASLPEGTAGVEKPRRDAHGEAVDAEVFQITPMAPWTKRHRGEHGMACTTTRCTVTRRR